MNPNDHTTRAAAQLLGVSVRTVQLWLEKGQLQGWKTSGGHRRISHDSVEQLRQLRTPHNALAAPRPLNVLVVEDNASLLKLYRKQISAWPFATTLFTASNGFEGLVMVGKVCPDLMVCDLRLPGVTGFQIVRALCAMPRYQHMRIVVVSGMPANEIAAHGDLPKRVSVMGKPIDFQTLQHIGLAQLARSSNPKQTQP